MAELLAVILGQFVILTLVELLRAIIWVAVAAIAYCWLQD